MRKFLYMLFLCGAAVSAHAEVSDGTLETLANKQVTLIKVDGSEVRGEIGAFDSDSVVIITPDGEVIQIGRKDVASVGEKNAPSADQTASAGAAPQERPVSPDLAALLAAPKGERQSAFDDRLKLTADPNTLSLKMGADGRLFPIDVWEPVLKGAPPAYDLFIQYRNRNTIALVLSIAGSALVLPGSIMALTGPLLVAAICDFAGAGVLLVSLFVRPSGAEVQKIADAYNEFMRQELNVSAASSGRMLASTAAEDGV